MATASSVGKSIRVVGGKRKTISLLTFPSLPDADADDVIAVGRGTADERLEIGIVAIEESSWHFGLAPEVGVMIPVGYYTNFIAGARYNYAFKSGDSPEYQWLTFSVGFAWTN